MKWFDRFMVWMFGAVYRPKIAIDFIYDETNDAAPANGAALNEQSLEALSKRFHKGELIRHFKRQWSEPSNKEYLYIYIGDGIHTETNEKFVLYAPVEGPKVIYCRPHVMFHSEVDRQKYPTTTQKFRFEKASSHDCLITNGGRGYYVV